MNTFHEINIMTSRGDVNGAFSLIRYRSESVARKIMKKAGYSVPVHTGRAFWAWIQETLSASARECRSGYQVREERESAYRGYRQRTQDDYEAYVQMMSGSVYEAERRPAENNITESVKPDENTDVAVAPVKKTGRAPQNNHTADSSLKRTSIRGWILYSLNVEMFCRIMKRRMPRYVPACCPEKYNVIITSHACLYYLLMQSVADGLQPVIMRIFSGLFRRSDPGTVPLSINRLHAPAAASVFFLYLQLCCRHRRSAWLHDWRPVVRNGVCLNHFFPRLRGPSAYIWRYSSAVVDEEKHLFHPGGQPDNEQREDRSGPPRIRWPVCSGQRAESHNQYQAYHYAGKVLKLPAQPFFQKVHRIIRMIAEAISSSDDSIRFSEGFRLMAGSIRKYSISSFSAYSA